MRTGEVPAGRRYGEYEIESLLGKGSIGKVYLARHLRIGRRVALKLIDAEQKFDSDEDRDEFYRRLQREAELCGSLQHPNIVTLYDVGYEGDVVSYLATEYVRGDSLLARLKRTRPLPIAEALSIGVDLLRGLTYAHVNGVIHRDIKPANILLTEDGRAKIADFGIARPLDSSLTGINALLGTPNYMSPEQVKSTAVTPRADLFSTGVVLYEMLTGVKPFVAADLSGILFNIVNLDPPLASAINPAVPEKLALLVKRLLAKSPAERYASAAEALRELEEFRGLTPHPDDMTTPLPTEKHTLAWYRRNVNSFVFWGVSIALVAALVLSITTLRSRMRREPPPVNVAQQQRELDAKRRALESARTLVASGNYADAIARYDAFLAKYPQSDVAKNEREEAQQLLDKHIAAHSEVTSTAVASASTKPPEPAPKPPSRWQRFKRWFKGS
ncbi:MAG TPA: serine/threonine-protein kinase [Thermoanaerobaculia bacterium]|nr:serine/threonine-protein kinase [Thermoanaerobaculia bacterium]